MPKMYTLLVGGVGIGTLVPTFLHASLFNFSWLQFGLAFFFLLNSIIAVWELCLFYRIDEIKAKFLGYAPKYRKRELSRVIELFTQEVPWEGVLKASTWADIWATYSLFDESYSDSKSYGFFIDSGNGFSSLLPSLYCLVGTAIHWTWLPSVLSPRWFGVIMLLTSYQMWYGTVIYFFSYCYHQRYKGFPLSLVAIFVGISNGIWIGGPVLGMYAAGRMIAEDTFACLL